jgi:hypothetical protein
MILQNKHAPVAAENGYPARTPLEISDHQVQAALTRRQNVTMLHALRLAK